MILDTGRVGVQLALLDMYHANNDNNKEDVPFERDSHQEKKHFPKILIFIAFV